MPHSPATQKTIWLTGCTSGLGYELLLGFAEKGHTLASCARSSDKIEALKEKLPLPHYLASVDVSDDEAVQAFCEEAHSLTGPPDLLINNAAIINPNAPLWKIPATDFDQLTAININGTANLIRHTLPYMIREEKGIIVNLSSGWGRSTAPEVAPYCASKWAIEGLTQALAQELPPGLAAIPLNPGIIDTPMLQTTFGPSASGFPNARQWTQTAIPFLLNLTPAQNGHPPHRPVKNVKGAWASCP